jgi:hypothetical protein
MKHAVRILVLFSAASLTGCDSKPAAIHHVPVEPKQKQTFEISSKGGGFKIAFPGQPTKQDDSGTDDKSSESYFYKTSDFAYIVGYSYPKLPNVEMNEKTIAGGLDGAAESFVRRSRGTFKSKKEIQLQGYHGLEFRAKLVSATDSGETMGRVYWVDGKLIRIVVIGPNEIWILSNEVRDFFDSFSLLKLE